MARFRAVRGTFDLLPKQMRLWVKVESQARELARRFGFGEIRTPLFEQAELFTRGMGVMSGLIEKELWTFQDKFGQKLALRADMTSGVARAFQEDKLYEGELPQKVFYLGPVFLLGKEGEESSRQSHQFGAEALGCSSPAIDAEIISLAATFCESLGVEGYSIHLNTLGGSECRNVYQAKLRDYFGANQDKLCPTCKRKFKVHPDWVLSCPEQGCNALAQVAPTIYGMLSNGLKQYFATLREYLEKMDLPVELDPRVIPDSEYYNQTVFEIRVGTRVIGFGGRYDGLVEKLGGKSTPAVGFAISIEEVIDILGDKDEACDAGAPMFFFQPEGVESSKILVPMVAQLRRKGISVGLDYRTGGSSSKAPSGCSYIVVLDESNAFRGNAVIKDLVRDKEEKVQVLRLESRILSISGLTGELVERSSDSSGVRKKLKRVSRRQENESKVSSDGDESSGQQSHRERRLLRAKARPADDASAAERDPSLDKKSGSNGGSDERARGPEKRYEREKRRPAKEPVKTGDGKALVPAFRLGGPSFALQASSEPSKSVTKPAAPRPTPVIGKPAPKAVGDVSLNWSIQPGGKELKTSRVSLEEKDG